MKHRTLLLCNIMTIASISAHIKVPISIGDLVDKITILQVKLEKIEDVYKKENVLYELDLLMKIFTKKVPQSEQLQELLDALKKVNSKLWDIENGTRSKAAKKEFDQEFITLAQNVYINNNHRHELKREINIITGSRIIEEKQYTAYK